MTDPFYLRPRRSRPSGAAVAFAAAVVAVAVIAIGGVVASTGRIPTSQTPTSPAALRLAAIQQVLRQRSAAVIHHDRRAFLATIDPRRRAFRRRQARMFDNLAAVHFGSWSYAISPTGRALPPDAAGYRGQVWAPADFTLNYRLAHFDALPTNLRQYPTFVQRAGRWYLGSLSDYASVGLVSATELWDYGPVSVVRRPGVLVLGPPAQRATMLGVASEVASAIPQVSSVWGSDWARRAVVLVPQTMREMARIASDHEALRDVAALTSAEISPTAGSPSPVGDRITINPQNWPKLSAVGQQVVIRHELTHVASEAVTGSQTPTWLVEGLAEYVGFAFTDVPVASAASELQAVIRQGRIPTSLPGDAGFGGANSQLAVHYEEAWFACRLIAQQFGVPTLVRFYRAVGTSTRSSAAALRTALRRVLHARMSQFIAAWQAQMRAELG